MGSFITEELVLDQARRLNREGIAYTGRQLYYAACAAAEPPEVSGGTAQVGCGCLLGLVAALLGPTRLPPILRLGIGVLAITVVVGGILRRRSEARATPPAPILGISFPDFERLYVSAPDAPSVQPPPGIIEVSAWRSPPLQGGVLIVCDRAETAAFVSVNLGCAAAVSGSAEARGLGPGDDVCCLHDADPRGCALPFQLLRAGVGTVVDAGVRPELALRGRFQVIEGAPVLIPPEAERCLTGPEVEWLRDGRRLEVAALPPRVLLDAVRLCLERTGVQRPLPGGPVLLDDHLSAGLAKLPGWESARSSAPNRSI